jgi:L-seryl-tRNA(Ser) seleniumtransferase
VWLAVGADPAVTRTQTAMTSQQAQHPDELPRLDPVLRRGVPATDEERDPREVRRVINATGTVLHDDLGRAPLSAAARAALLEAAGYAAITAPGRVGGPEAPLAVVCELLTELTGAPAATVVGSDTSALLLALTALARDREVVVSRGELAELDDGGRIPELVAAAGAQLVEVGTTNRTRVEDVRAAIGPATALLLTVTSPGFRILGGTEQVGTEPLVALGREHGVPVVAHLGAAPLRPAETGPTVGLPGATTSVAAGVELTILAGDGLLGGPRAGLALGGLDPVRRCAAHPIAPALRGDALQLAALAATLRSYRRAPVPLDLPVTAMLHADPAQLARRAARIAERLGDRVTTVATQSPAGGRAHPELAVPSTAVVVPSDEPDALLERLRGGTPAVIGRTGSGGVVLDLRTVPPVQDDELLERLADALG